MNKFQKECNKVSKTFEQLDIYFGKKKSRRGTLFNKALAKAYVNSYERFNKGAY